MLFWPEWPAATVILGVAVRFMVRLIFYISSFRIFTPFTKVSSLDDIKTSTQSENNAAKTMALDHLGIIAARLRPSSMRTSRSNVHLTSVDEVGIHFREIILYTDALHRTSRSVTRRA